jgi:hypothetical protein
LAMWGEWSGAIEGACVDDLMMANQRWPIRWSEWTLEEGEELEVWRVAVRKSGSGGLKGVLTPRCWHCSS